MKKTIRRSLSLMLALCLLLSMSVMATASTVSWGSGLDAKYLVLTAGDSYIEYVFIAETGSFVHEMGTQDIATATGSYSASLAPGYVMDDLTYRNYIKEAIELEDLVSSTLALDLDNPSILISATQPSGTYGLYVEFECKDAAWSVYSGTTITRAAGDTTSGTVSHVPTGDYSIVARELA